MGAAPKIVCFVGPSGSGKTALIEKLIPELQRRGLHVGVIKNDAHTFQIDREGKDSDRFFRAGAEGVVIQSPAELAFRRAQLERQDPADIAARYFPDCDLALVEGASWSPHPKIEVWRSAAHQTRLDPAPAPLLALITDSPDKALDASVPVFAWDDIDAVAAFICSNP